LRISIWGMPSLNCIGSLEIKGQVVCGQEGYQELGFPGSGLQGSALLLDGNDA